MVGPLRSHPRAGSAASGPERGGDPRAAGRDAPESEARHDRVQSLPRCGGSVPPDPCGPSSVSARPGSCLSACSQNLTGSTALVCSQRVVEASAHNQLNALSTHDILCSVLRIISSLYLFDLRSKNPDRLYHSNL